MREFLLNTFRFISLINSFCKNGNCIVQYIIKKFYVYILRTDFLCSLHCNIFNLVIKTVKLIIYLQRTTVLFMHIYNRSHSLENTTCSIVFVILLRLFLQLYLCKPVIDRHQTLFCDYCFRC